MTKSEKIKKAQVDRFLANAPKVARAIEILEKDLEKQGLRIVRKKI